MAIKRRKTNWGDSRMTFTFEPGIPGLSEGLFLFKIEKRDPVSGTRKTFRLRMPPRSGVRLAAQVAAAIKEYEKSSAA
jgi:hypothetical protein